MTLDVVVVDARLQRSAGEQRHEGLGGVPGTTGGDGLAEELALDGERPPGPLTEADVEEQGQALGPAPLLGCQRGEQGVGRLALRDLPQRDRALGDRALGQHALGQNALGKRALGSGRCVGNVGGRGGRCRQVQGERGRQAAADVLLHPRVVRGEGPLLVHLQEGVVPGGGVVAVGLVPVEGSPGRRLRGYVVGRDEHTLGAQRGPQRVGDRQQALLRRPAGGDLRPGALVRQQGDGQRDPRVPEDEWRPGRGRLGHQDPGRALGQRQRVDEQFGVRCVGLVCVRRRLDGHAVADLLRRIGFGREGSVVRVRS